MSPVTWLVVCRVPTYEQYSCYVVVDRRIGFQQSWSSWLKFWGQSALTLSQQKFDGTIFDRKTKFYTFASMNFMEHKRLLRSTADVLTIHDLKLHSATDVRLEHDVSRKSVCSIAPPGRMKYSNKSQSRMMFGKIHPQFSHNFYLRGEEIVTSVNC